MTIKECVYRELKYGLCRDGALSGLVDPSAVKLDMRGTVSSTKSESDYPQIVFMRTRNTEDNQIRYSKDDFDIAFIGLQSSPTKGDALLETIRLATIDHLAGKLKTIGKYTADGTADPTGGLKVKAVYIRTEEVFDSALQEKIHIASWTFTRIR